MRVEDFDYALPEEYIAQTPLKNREESRLMVLDRRTGDIEHRRFRDILEYLRKGDLLVINDTKVIPARLFGVKESTGARIETFLLKPVKEGTWETLVRPAKRVHEGDAIIYGGGRMIGRVLGDTPQGGRIIEFEYDVPFDDLLDQIGEMPLPPYIKVPLEEKNRYQTVYAFHKGSVAAPTAGLHFTERLLQEVEKLGVGIARVTLHVGLGTFRPVKTDNVEEHVMHEEFYILPDEAADAINDVRSKGGRVIAVGTTSVRTLETCSDEEGKVHPGSGWTGIFIYPGYRFKAVDALITNFHLPKSTLLMLVSAFAGREWILSAYEEAKRMGYRFFSFGDAMFIQ